MAIKELHRMLNKGMRIEKIFCDDSMTYGVMLSSEQDNKYWIDIKVPFTELAKDICYNYKPQQIKSWSTAKVI